MRNRIPEMPATWLDSNRMLNAIVYSHILMLLLGAIWGIDFLIRNHYEPIIVTPVLAAKPADVTSIVVAPIQTRPTKSNLVAAPVTIQDPVAIAKICGALSKARPFSLNHPKSSWECVLIINTRTGSYRCVVDSTESSKNGVLILFNTNGEWGWSIGEYRSDALGPALAAVVRQHQHITLAPGALGRMPMLSCFSFLRKDGKA